MKRPPPGRDSERARLDEWIARFSPEIARRARTILAALRRRLPGAFELVYDKCVRTRDRLLPERTSVGSSAFDRDPPAQSEPLFPIWRPPSRSAPHPRRQRKPRASPSDRERRNATTRSPGAGRCSHRSLRATLRIAGSRTRHRPRHLEESPSSPSLIGF